MLSPCIVPFLSGPYAPSCRDELVGLGQDTLDILSIISNIIQATHESPDKCPCANKGPTGSCHNVERTMLHTESGLTFLRDDYYWLWWTD